MNAKKLMVVSAVSNEMLNDASGLADEWVQTEAERASARAEDLAFIRGAGTVNSPRGLLFRVAGANTFGITHAGAAATVAEVMLDLGRAISRLANGNVPMERAGWVMSKRTEWFLKTILTATDIRVFSEMEKGTLLGFPFAGTTQIPNNLNASGAGTNDESELYFADFMSCVIGDTGEYEVKAMDGAAYFDTGSAAIVSGLSQDQTVIVIKRRVDFTSLYEGADIAVVHSVDWGA
jgi:HK97 family phage major capsid protein